MEVSIEKIERHLKDVVQMACNHTSSIPYIYFILKKVEILWTTNLPHPILITSDSKLILDGLYLYEKGRDKEGFSKEALMLIAAALAIGLRHNVRKPLDAREPYWSYASNRSVSNILRDNRFIIHIHRDGDDNKLVEEIYEELDFNKVIKPKPLTEKYLGENEVEMAYLIQDPEVKKVYRLQAGAEELYDEKIDRDTLEERWINLLLTGLATSMGGQPLGLKREVDKLINPELTWDQILKNEVKKLASAVRRTSWRRPHRRLGDIIPGYEEEGRPVVWALIDVSGSISREDLTRFFSELLGIVRHAAKITVVFWEGEVTGVETIKSKGDIQRIMNNVKGGGGTVIKDALRYYIRHAKSRDTLIIFSDGLIYDWKSDETQELLTRASKKAGKIYFVSVDDEPIHPGVIHLKYRKRR